MYTNPFRRSSLKDASTDSIANAPSAEPISIPETSGTPASALHVNTRVPSSNQKHVNFASPPAVPISPVSYPSSPESTRISPAFPTIRPIPLATTDYTQAIQSDPFRAVQEPDENDRPIAEALENAKANAALVALEAQPPKENAVRNTLSKFASVPRRAPALEERDDEQRTTPARQTMDVDAFKRLLLTGDSGLASTPQEEQNQAVLPTPPTVSESSSTGDTTSISQRSLVDQNTTTLEESPRTSHEYDTSDVDVNIQSTTGTNGADQKRKPPPPKPRYGKAIASAQPNPIIDVDSISSLSGNVSDSIPHINLPPTQSTAPKVPPAPPLARRRSNNSGPAQRSSSRRSSTSEPDVLSGAIEPMSKPPPPPPTRRPMSMATERRPSHDLSPTAEESDSDRSQRPPSRTISDPKPPPPPPARNVSSSKRSSLGMMNPPPLPPPRRGRGSSRSSIDSQRPAISTIMGGDSARDSGEYTRPGLDSRQDSSSFNTHDIMADLAALQQEVDDARRRAGL